MRFSPETSVEASGIARQHFIHTGGLEVPFSVGMRSKDSMISSNSGHSQKGLPKRLLTIQEAAKLLHVHANTVRRWDRDGQLNAYRVGRRRDRRFDEEDILRFLEHTAEEPSAGADVQVDLTQ